MLLLLFLYRSKSDLLYYAEYLPTISTQLKIISSVKAATPSDISVCWTLILDGSFLWMTGIEKPWIPVCPLVKQLSHFACRGHFLLVLVNDLLRRLLAQTLARWAREFESYLTSNKICLSRTTRRNIYRAVQMVSYYQSINQSINQARLFKRVTLMSRKKAGYKKCMCKMAIICDRPFPNHL